MNSQENRSPGRRRGPRRRRHNEGGNRHEEGYTPQGGQRSSGPRQSEAPKPSLFQRILSFFGFGPKKKTYPPYEGTKSVHPTQQRAASNAASNASSQRNGSAPSGSSSPAPSRPARKPEAVEVTSPKLYVGNLSFDATESDLSELFNGVGAVKNVEIVTYRDTEKSKGFGFVTMTAIEEAVRAVSELHDKEFMGRRLVVSGAKTNDRASAPSA